MLDSSPPSIVVGRTLSSYFVGDIQNNQETITYTVYNEQADPETGVLLTTTLEPGVTFASASQQPDQSGQNLAWSLGTIQGYDRASVTLTVALASPSPTQLDSGAQAFATLDAGAVSAVHARRDLEPGKPLRPQPARLHARRQHHRPVHPGRGGRARLRPDSRSSTSCTPRSATTRTPARCAVPAARSGRAPAMRSTSPAWAWP